MASIKTELIQQGSGHLNLRHRPIPTTFYNLLFWQFGQLRAYCSGGTRIPQQFFLLLWLTSPSSKPKYAVIPGMPNTHTQNSVLVGPEKESIWCKPWYQTTAYCLHTHR